MDRMWRSHGFILVGGSVGIRRFRGGCFRTAGTFQQTFGFQSFLFKISVRLGKKFNLVSPETNKKKTTNKFKKKSSRSNNPPKKTGPGGVEQRGSLTHVLADLKLGFGFNDREEESPVATTILFETFFKGVFFLIRPSATDFLLLHNLWWKGSGVQ